MAKELPEGWEMTIIKNISRNIQYGYTAKSFAIGNIKYLRITDIQNNKVDWETVPYCEINEKEKEKFLLEKNDIVFARTGATVGKSFLIKDLPNDSVFASYLIRLKPSKIADIKWINYFFRSRSYWNQISENASGIGQPNVNASKLGKLQVPLPPLPEQERIVGKLDEVFAHLDVVKEKLERIPELVKDFRQSVLMKAVTGELTKEWRNGKELGEWEERKIKNFTSKVGSGSTPRGGNNSYKTEGIPLIRSMNVHFGGIKYDGLAFIDENQAEKLKNVEVHENDVLLNITGASIGRVCLAPIELEGARVNQHVAIIRPEKQIIPEFLELFLASSIIQDYIMTENYGVTRQALTKTQILNLEIKHPPIEEQQEIVRRVEDLFARVDAIETAYERLKAKVEDLPQAVLAKAFRAEM